MLERQRAAATTIQAWWRGCVQRQKHLQLQRAVVAIQAAVRMRADRLRYVKLVCVHCMTLSTDLGHTHNIRHKDCSHPVGVY